MKLSRQLSSKLSRATLSKFVVACIALMIATSAKASNRHEDSLALYRMELKELINVKITSATGKSQKATDAPAIVSVISAEDITFWQYRSVADALANLPGFYCINDYLSPNCGVRGTNGGFRGYSKVIKVMINGQTIAFRSNTANYLGPELVPMNVIERIEVVRGPVSALYGAVPMPFWER